jgi:hypothetical protein
MKKSTGSAMNAEERVQWLVENRKKLMDEKHAFAVKHGFAYKRSQNYKDCVVIRWKASQVKYKINHPRIEEYVSVCHAVSDKYNLWDEDDPFLDSDLRLMQAGIYCITEWEHPTWAIPNEFKEVQDFVLSSLPKWAKVSRYEHRKSS